MSDTCPGCGATMVGVLLGWETWECGTRRYDAPGSLPEPSIRCLTRQLTQRDERIKELEARESARATQAAADLEQGRECVNGRCHWGREDSRAMEYDGRCLYCRIAELEAELRALDAVSVCDGPLWAVDPGDPRYQHTITLESLKKVLQERAELRGWRARWEPVVEAARELACGVTIDRAWDVAYAVRKAEETP